MGKIWREELTKIVEVIDDDKPQYLIAQEILRVLNIGETLNSTKIAENTFTSRPTVIRFAQSFGFEGFREFARELKKQDNVYYFEPEIKSFEQSYQDYNNLVNNSINLLGNYKDQIIDIAKLLKENERIFIFTSPEATLMGNIFADRLKFISFESYSVLNNQHLLLANTIRPKDLLLFIVTGFDNESLLHLWNIVNPTTNTVLIASTYQFDKFKNPNFAIKLEIGQNIMRTSFQHFLIQYILDQIYNLIMYSDSDFFSSTISSEYRL